MNNTITLPSTLMVKGIPYEFKGTERQDLIEESTRLLQQYEYEEDCPYPTDHVDKIIDEWSKENGWLINLLQKSPDYINGKFMIKVKATLERKVDKEKLNDFYNWILKEVRAYAKENEYKIGMFSFSEIVNIKDKYYDIYDRISSDRRYGIVGTYNGLSEKEVYNEYERYRGLLSNHIPKVKYYKGSYVSTEISNKLCALVNVIEYVAYNMGGKENNPNIIDDEDIESIKGRLNHYGILEKSPFKAEPLHGQKITKFVGKLLKEIGFNKIVDMQDIYNPVTGEYLRTQDRGYNYYFALLGDAINPTTYDKDLIISVNPIDYWTSSFGWKWASCHTIDKTDLRGIGTYNHHQGCYSGGTESYMLDDSTFVVYVPYTEGYEGTPYELMPKLKRCLFSLGEDKMLQMRMYPDGRDGGDEGLAAQVRNIVQKVIADLYETSNMWTLKKGTNACEHAVKRGSGAVNYPDYIHYEDCNVSYLRRVDGLLNENKIIVGAYPICPGCGCTHTREQSIVCNDCADDNYVTCYECGDRFNPEYEGHYINGDYYCCNDCAESSGYRYCFDDEEWHSEDAVWWDAYREGYFYDERDMVSAIDDRYESEIFFFDGINAENYGCVYCEYDDRWATEDYVREIGDTGVYFVTTRYTNTDYITTTDGMYFPDAESAEGNGYTVDENGNWVEADEDDE